MRRTLAASRAAFAPVAAAPRFCTHFRGARVRQLCAKRPPAGPATGRRVGPLRASLLDDAAPGSASGAVPSSASFSAAIPARDAAGCMAGERDRPARILGVPIGPHNARFILALVTFLWGSFPVIIKFLYAPSLAWSLKPFPFNAIRLVAGAAICAPFVLRMHPSEWNPAVVAGLELGGLTLLVNIAQVLALAYTSAGRVSFLTQLQTFMVPLAMFFISWIRPAASNSSSTSNSVPTGTLISTSVMAVLGTSLLAFDKPQSAIAAAGVISANVWKGDMLGVCSAICATVYIIRSGVHAVRLPATALAGLKVMSQALFAVVQVLVVAAYRGARSVSTAQVQTFFAGATAYSLFINALGVFYGGAIVCGLSTALQLGAQAHISASEAAVILAFVPVWTAVVAALFCREIMGPFGIAGAACIFAASIFAALASGTAKPSSKKA